MQHYSCFILLLFLFSNASAQNKLPTLWYVDERDGNSYNYIYIDGLYWFTENLRYKTQYSIAVKDTSGNVLEHCGLFYRVDESFEACPLGWRLPTEKEVKRLIKLDKRKKIQLTESLQIELCGRIDHGKLSKLGLQNTFWIDATLKDGYITHWHTFEEKQELHHHNVMNAQRQFPIRCVCEGLNQPK